MAEIEYRFPEVTAEVLESAIREKEQYLRNLVNNTVVQQEDPEKYALALAFATDEHATLCAQYDAAKAEAAAAGNAEVLAAHVQKLEELRLTAAYQAIQLEAAAADPDTTDERRAELERLSSEERRHEMELAAGIRALVAKQAEATPMTSSVVTDATNE